MISIIPIQQNVTIGDFKKNGYLNLAFPYISNENPKRNGYPDRIRTIKLQKDNIHYTCERKDEESLQGCILKIKNIQNVNSYDKNLGTPNQVSCYVGNKQMKCL
jgi:hypothetical protein